MTDVGEARDGDEHMHRAPECVRDADREHRDGQVTDVGEARDGDEHMCRAPPRV